MLKRRWIFIVYVTCILLVAFFYIVSNIAIYATDNVGMIFKVEESENTIIIHGSTANPAKFFARSEVKIEGQKAYITVYYYSLPFFKSKKTGDFQITIDNSDKAIQEVFLDDGKTLSEIYSERHN